MIIKGLLFDMDGVLIETEQYHYQAWQEAFKLKNIKLTREDYTKYCQAQGRKNAIKNILKQPTNEDYEVLSIAKANAYKTSIDNNKVVLYHDAKVLLAYLEKRQHIQLAIASSSVVADYVIKKTDVSWQFSHFITGAMIERNKPFPDIFNLAAKNINISKKNLAVIEDSIAGITAARLAGINVFALNRDHSLDHLDPVNLESYLQEIDMTLTDELKLNIRQSTTIPISNLSEIIPFL